jgi:hypothetical protein
MWITPQPQLWSTVTSPRPQPVPRGKLLLHFCLCRVLFKSNKIHPCPIALNIGVIQIWGSQSFSKTSLLTKDHTPTFHLDPPPSRAWSLLPGLWRTLTFSIPVGLLICRRWQALCTELNRYSQISFTLSRLDANPKARFDKDIPTPVSI